MNIGKRYFYAGDWLHLSALARVAGVDRRRLGYCLARGMSLDDALADARRCTTAEVKRITLGNKSLTYSEWAKQTGILPDTLRERIEQYHWTAERALTEPVMTATERRIRRHNLRIINHIAVTIRTAKQAGGAVQTSKDGLGTGQGSHRPP